LIATGLAARGWDVSYVYGLGERYSRAPPTTSINFAIYEADTSVLRGAEPPKRWWLKRYTRGLSLFRILLKIDPDIVFVSFGGSLAGFAAIYCLMRKKKLVYRAGTSMHADLSFRRADLLEFGFMARQLHSFAVRKADAIVTNARYVAEIFRKNLPGQLIRVIPNGLEIVPAISAKRPSYVVWLARMERIKNPIMFVRLAKELPSIQFLMHGSGRLYGEVAELAFEVPNLIVRGAIIGEKKDEVLGSALVLVNTSLAEGFPNTLIEAGIYSVPYISFVDPDEVICRHELGYHVRSFRELVEKTSFLVRDQYIRRKFGTNIRRYVEREHNIERSVSEYDHILKTLL
jgi:glycosyltransferase involved in cell wall biosynthesis